MQDCKYHMSVIYQLAKFYSIYPISYQVMYCNIYYILANISRNKYTYILIMPAYQESYKTIKTMSQALRIITLKLSIQIINHF